MGSWFNDISAVRDRQITVLQLVPQFFKYALPHFSKVIFRNPKLTGNFTVIRFKIIKKGIVEYFLLKLGKFPDSSMQKVVVPVISEAVGNSDKFNIHIFCPIPDNMLFDISKDITLYDFFIYAENGTFCPTLKRLNLVTIAIFPKPT